MVVPVLNITIRAEQNDSLVGSNGRGGGVQVGYLVSLAVVMAGVAMVTAVRGLDLEDGRRNDNILQYIRYVAGASNPKDSGKTGGGIMPHIHGMGIRSPET